MHRHCNKNVVEVGEINMYEIGIVNFQKYAFLICYVYKLILEYVHIDNFVHHSKLKNNAILPLLRCSLNIWNKYISLSDRPLCVFNLKWIHLEIYIYNVYIYILYYIGRGGGNMKVLLIHMFFEWFWWRVLVFQDHSSYLIFRWISSNLRAPFLDLSQL